MGLMGTLLKLTGLGLAALFFLPNIPPNYEFKKTGMSKAPKMVGPLAPNNILDKVTPMELDSPIVGPESLEMRGEDEIFTGMGDGRLVRIKNGKVSNIGNFGNSCKSKKPGKDDPPCGRIAGVRFDQNGKLLCCDLFNGIFEVDVDTGKWKHLISSKGEGVSPSMANDLDVDKNGNIYWSDTSTISQFDSFMLELLAGPSGKLNMFNPKTGKNRVLMSNLHFANGVQLSHDEDFVLVSELLGGRVWRYYLKGEKQGESDIFVDNLPGGPDNVRANGKGGFYISMCVQNLPEKGFSLDFVGNWPRSRRFVVRLQDLVLKSLKKVEELFPNVVVSDAISWVKGMNPLIGKFFDSKKVTIVEVDGNGKILRSFQNDKSPIAIVSEIRVAKEWTYLGSPTMDKLYRMKTADLKQ